MALELRAIAKLKDRASQYRFFPVDLEWLLANCAQKPTSRVYGCQFPVLTTYFISAANVVAKQSQGKIDRGSIRACLYKCNDDDNCLELSRQNLTPNALMHSLQALLTERKRQLP